MGSGARLPAIVAGLASLVLALGIVCHSVAEFSARGEILEVTSSTGGRGGRGGLERQRGAMAGARAGRVSEPRVGQVLSQVDDESEGVAARAGGNEPLVTVKTVQEALSTIKGNGIRGISAKGTLQQLRYTGRYADTSYVVNAPEGDPATVVAHNSIWPSLIHRDQPYVEQVPSRLHPFSLPTLLFPSGVPCGWWCLSPEARAKGMMGLLRPGRFS